MCIYVSVPQKDKLWYAMFALISRARMEEEGREDAWTLPLQSAMRSCARDGELVYGTSYEHWHCLKKQLMVAAHS